VLATANFSSAAYDFFRLDALFRRSNHQNIQDRKITDSFFPSNHPIGEVHMIQKFQTTTAKIVFGLLISGLFLAMSSPTCDPNSSQEITIMAANITSGDNSAYEAPGIRIFQGLKPDVVLIQEFQYNSGSLRDFVTKAFGPEYSYSIETGGDNIPNGVVSRYPIISAGQWADSVVSDRDFAWAVIDIPGNIDLQVVSVHLSGQASGERSQEAQALKNYVAKNFDPSQYIVIGGDLNVGSSTEAAINTFRSFLVPDGHIPVDQKGNRDTNEPRSKPYDWVMPNALLNNAHSALRIGTSSFVHGLVFDSYVYPEPLPGSIQHSDSHVSGMQHMPVMKAFSVRGVR
jgi:endonuclease/exonuclease/phosphatase family metal-dependent hydrolase